MTINNICFTQNNFRSANPIFACFSFECNIAICFNTTTTTCNSYLSASTLKVSSEKKNHCLDALLLGYAQRFEINRAFCLIAMNCQHSSIYFKYLFSNDFRW